jgi:drug/metabolite transporter (DMT)-like permease
VVAGALIQASQALYFQSLAHAEAGIVAAYWNLVPALLPVAAFVVVGDVLAPVHVAGIAILILASACFTLLDANRDLRWSTFAMMFVASTVQVSAILIMKAGYSGAPFYVGFLLVTLGIVGAGIAPLLHPWVRRAFSENMSTLRPALLLILGIEVANLVALFMSQRAIDLGVPSLVAAVETTIPAYTFGLSLVLALTTRFGDGRAGSRLPLKVALIAAMIGGVFLVSQGHETLLAN